MASKHVRKKRHVVNNYLTVWAKEMSNFADQCAKKKDHQKKHNIAIISKKDSNLLKNTPKMLIWATFEPSQTQKWT
jgi:hypothetical protein